MKIKLDLKLDNKDYYYRINKNKNGHLVRQRVYKKSKDAIFQSTELSATDNMISEFNLDNIIAKNQIKDKISKALTHLTPREERVIRRRFGIGLNTDYTLEQIGSSKEFYVTADRIRQIEAKALRKLSYYCKDFKELVA